MTEFLHSSLRIGEPNPKPVKGSARAARVQDQIGAEEYEARQKTAARKRDGRCRWPHCDCKQRRDRLEVAHVVNKSAGGSSHVSNLIVLCQARHRGRPSLHSGDLRIEPLTDEGTNAGCAFWATDSDGKKYMVARERAPFFYEVD